MIATELLREIRVRAAILVELNKPLMLAELELTNLGVGQVLVDLLVSGICGSQLQELNGNKGNAKFLPHLIGHEGCGIVNKIGPGVSTVKPGDKVVLHWRPGLGIESDFPKYILNGKTITSGKVNTLTEKAIVSENRITPIPHNTNPELAALLGCSLTTALGIINNESNLKFGESVGVIGCGGVGLSLISASRAGGAGEIYAVDNSPLKRELCLKQGATHFHNSISDLPNKIDLIVDTTGDPYTISNSIEKLSKYGRLILVGQPEPKKSLLIPNALNLFNGSGISIKASQGGSSVPHIDIPRYLNLFSLGLISMADIVTHRFKLENVNLAIETLKSGNAGRIMIEI